MAHNAKAGGEIGANGEFYKGGQFVADSENTIKGQWNRIKQEGLSVWYLVDIHLYKVEHYDTDKGQYVTDEFHYDDRRGNYTEERKLFFKYLIALYTRNIDRISRQEVIDAQYASGCVNWWGALKKGMTVEDCKSIDDAQAVVLKQKMEDTVKEAGIRCATEVIAEAEANRKATIVSKHIGNVGDKLERDIEVIKVVSFESDFGGGRIYIMKDTEGNEIVWMTSTCLKLVDGLVAQEGDKARIKFTVKEHAEYMDVPQTKVFRVKAVA